MTKKYIERLMVVLSLAGIAFILYLVISSAVEYSKQETNEVEISTGVEETPVEEPTILEEEKKEVVEEKVEETVPTMNGFVFDQDTMKQDGYVHIPKVTKSDLTDTQKYRILDAEDNKGYLYNYTKAMKDVSSSLGTVVFNGVYSDAIYSLRECTGEYKDLYETFYYVAGNVANYISITDGKEIPFNTAFDIGVGLSNWEDFFDYEDYTTFKVEDELYYQLVYYFSEEIDLGKVTYLCSVHGTEENPEYTAYGILETDSGRMFVVSLRDTMYKYTYAYINDVFTNSLVVVE